ncbi:hypothetical protein COCNU_scaffold013378G000010 [Cocos nucifera]|nr:hypothetical protein [Cocos nucifera]
MDTQAVEMLTKRLHAWKRKGKASDGSLKKVKVDAPSSTTPTTAAIASEVAKGAEVIPATEVGTIERGSMPPTFSSPPTKDQDPQPLAKREKGGEKKKKKVVMKMYCKVRPGESNDNSDNMEEDPFSNPKIVRDLIDKFTMLEVVDRMADLDHVQLTGILLGPFLR